MITHGAIIGHLGYLDDESKSQAISRAYAGVFPSMAEGFGIPAVEMRLAGKPVIVSDLPVYNETMNQSGRYFKIDAEQKKTVENLVEALMELETNNESQMYLDGSLYFDIKGYKRAILGIADED